MPSETILSEIEAVVRFKTERCDYGVDRSPEWEEIMPETMEIDSLFMFGRDWSEVDLRATFGDQGAEAFYGLIFAQVGDDWDED